jgi:hypothetical protein
LESYAYYIRDGKVQSTNVVNCQIRVIPWWKNGWKRPFTHSA